MSSPGEESAANRFLQAFLEDHDAGRERSLAEYQRQFRGFEDRVAREHSRLLGASTPAAPDDDVLAPGSRVGPYRLVHEIGRGGQGTVWCAEDSRIGRTVALKLLPAWSLAALARFRREAEVASRLEHPGICPVYDVDLEAGRPYVAMRLVEGDSLLRRIERVRGGEAVLPADEAARFVEQAARALHAAHQAGVVHRDVKPGNLMITPEGNVVVLDFGVARELEVQSLALTRTGEVFGTPAYMAPEQIEGREADARADVWALGVTLYEALSLRPPFQAPTREALFRAILSREPDAPRRDAVRPPRDLAVLVATALSKDRERRYQSALDLAEDIAAWRSGRPIDARPVGALGRLARWARREPRAAVLAAGLAVALLAASGIAGYLAAQRGRLEAGGVALAQQRRTDLVRDIAGGLIRGPDAERNAHAVLMEDPRVTSVRAAFAVHLARQGRAAEALALCDAAPADQEDTRALARARAIALRHAGRAAEADALETGLGITRSALEAFLASIAAEEAGGASAPRRALEEIRRAFLFMPGRGEVYLERLILCTNEFKDAASRREMLNAADVLQTLWPDSALAWFYVGLAFSGSDTDRARAAWRRSIELDVGLAQPYAAEHLHQMQEGDFDAARATFERGLAYTEPGTPERQRLLSVRAQACVLHGRAAEALDAADRALAIRPDSVTVLLLRARAQRALGAEDGDATLRRILELDPDNAHARELLGK